MEKNVTVINIYRPPNGKIEQFLVIIEEMLEELSGRDEFVFITGDFNIDLAGYGIESHSSRLINLCLSYDMKPVISVPTRVGKNRNTILDNIFTNFAGNNQAGVIQTNITDHFPIFVGLRQNLSWDKDDNVKVWNYNKQTIREFHELLEEMEMADTSSIRSTQTLYTVFNEKIAEAHMKAFTKLEKKKTTRTNFHGLIES